MKPILGLSANRCLLTWVLAEAMLAGLVCVAVLPTEVSAQRSGNRAQQGKLYGWDEEDTAPAIEREPFLEITLNRQNNSAILHVIPRLEDGQGNVIEPPYDLSRRGLCVFRFANESTEQYEVPWSVIERIRTYQDIILAEANQAMEQRDLKTAFRGFLYLYDLDRRNPQLRAALENYLFVDGQLLKDNGDFVEALTVFEELYDRNSSFQIPGQAGGLLPVIEECFEGWLAQRIEQNDLPEIRKILNHIESTYGERMPNISKKWRSRIVEIGESLLQEAREAYEGDDPFLAHERVRILKHANPEVKQTIQLFAEVAKKFPQVYVGVAEQPGKRISNNIFHFADRRVGRLTHRNLLEFLEPGDEGGKYVFPSGEFVPIDDAGLQYEFRIYNPSGAKPRLGVPPVSAYQLSSRLLQMGDFNSPSLHFPWARIVQSIEIKDESTVVVNLRYPHVRPECLLQVPFRVSGNELPVENGVYKTMDSNRDRTVYQLNPMYDRVEGRQHPRVIEQKFSSRSAATEALIRGEVDVVDRVFPLDLERLRQDPAIDVRPYNLPTVHMLIPNQRNDHMKSRDFRVGLLYGINRPAILKQILMGGKSIAGFVQVSGPLPRDTALSEQTAYGYNYDVDPQDSEDVYPIHNVHLGITMTQFTSVMLRDQLMKRTEKIFEPDFDLLTDEDPKTRLLRDIQQIVTESYGNQEALISRLWPQLVQSFPESQQDALKERLDSFVEKLPQLQQPTLTLAFPRDDVARIVCESIKQMWMVLGVQVELRELEPGVVIPDDDDWDFLFAETTMHEPLLDIESVLGKRGLTRNVSASSNQALHQLAHAERWTKASDALKTIHRYCHSDLSILPLWQVNEYYAYRKDVQNVGSGISNLYQNVDRWQLIPATNEDQ